MSQSPAVEQEYPEKIDSAVLKIAGVVVLGSIMSILDITVVNVALPTFMTDLDVANYSTVAWTVTGYTLALATVIPLTGWAADRFGTKRLYIAALALFTVGSVLCAMAQSIEALIAFRVIQGFGGGMLMPLGMTIMTRAAGPQRMGRLMAILGVPMLLGPILGPIIGGWLIEYTTWHWIFLINLPLGLGAMVYAWFALERDDPRPSETFDFIGMALMSPGLGLFLFGVSSIPEGGGSMSAPRVWVSMLVGGLLVVAFVIYSFRPKHPLLDFRLFKNFNLSISTGTMFLFAAAFFGGLLLVPTYFQQVRLESPLQAGLLIAPQGIGAMVTMPIAGALADKYPVGRIVPVGLVLITGGMLGLTQIGAETSYTYLISVLFVMGLGMGATMMPLMTAALRTLSHRDVARGSTLLNITQQIASSVGIAVISVVLTNRFNNSEAVTAARGIAEAQARGVEPQPQWLQLAEALGDQFQITAFAEMAQAFADSFWIAFGLCALTLVVSLFLPKKREPVNLTTDEGRPPVIIH